MSSSLKFLLTFILLFFLSLLNPISAQPVEWEDNGDGTWTKYQFEIDGKDGPGWYFRDWGCYNDDNWDYGMDWSDLQDLLSWWDDIEASNQSTHRVCPRLVSNTLKPLPANTARTKIGIGEEVLVGIRNNCALFCNWKISGPGVLSNQTQNYCNFQAQWTPGTIKITAELTGTDLCNPSCNTTLELEFEVVAPKSVYFDNLSIQNPDPCYSQVGHTFKRPGASFFSDNYLLPDDVNFYNNYVAESGDPATYIGPYFAGSGIVVPPHPVTAYVMANDIVVPGKGTLVKYDDIEINFLCDKFRDPKLSGEVQYIIGQFYLDFKANVGVLIEDVLQSGENNGTISGSSNLYFNLIKKTALVYTELLDPSTCHDGTVCPP